MSLIADACRDYRLQVIAHRLRKFGFENSLNKLSTDDLEALADKLYKHQHDAIIREVSRRRDACKQ